MTTKVRVKTEQFKFSHGREPKGSGNWAFSVGANFGDPRQWFFHNGTFAEARRAAVEEARRRGVSEVEVLP